MRTFLRYFLPPAIPLLPLIILAVWVLVSDAHAPVRIIDGQPDNAPTRAAVMTFVISPVIYSGLLFVHYLSLRFRRPSGGFFTPFVIAIIGSTLLLGSHDIYLRSWTNLGWCAAICAGAISPMAICSWLISRWASKQ